MKADIYRQLKFRLEAGDSLVSAFRTVGGPFKRLAGEIEKGAGLRDAVKKHGFPPADRMYLAIGEVSGRLENAFDALAELYDVRHHYESRLWAAFLKSLLVLAIGIIGSFFLFRAVNMELPLGIKIWYVVAVMILGILLAILQMLSPGLRRWTDLTGIAFCVASGLSFEDTKRELKASGARIRLNAGHYYKLISLPKNDRKLVRAGEETGKLDSALERVRSTASERMETLLMRLERGFYYTGVVLVMATILASVAVFAVSGFGKAF